jgi:hypothetical protein
MTRLNDRRKRLGLPLFLNPAYMYQSVRRTRGTQLPNLSYHNSSEQDPVLGVIIAMAGLLKTPFKLALVQLAAGKW